MKTERPSIEIGTKLWKTHDTRTYTVVGETSRSWLVRGEKWANWAESGKVAKAKLPEGWMLDEQEHKDWWWHATHLYHVSRSVERATPQQLRQIAALIGYDEEKKQ